jgi:hypothetical protein
MKYAGKHELWMRPDTPALEGDVRASLDDNVLSWTWTLDDDKHEGRLHLDGSSWQDSFHQSEAAPLQAAPAHGARFGFSCQYGPPDSPWTWLIAVCERPEGQLVVQMTNITPWGERQLAVQWIMDPQS